MIDDSLFFRNLIRHALADQDDLELIGTAVDALSGVEKVRLLKPDVVILDVDLPNNAGHDAFARIRFEHPELPVILLSDARIDGAGMPEERLPRDPLPISGPTESATKPANSCTSVEAANQIAADLVPKIRLANTRPAPHDQQILPTLRRRRSSRSMIESVVVGASTGGPEALEVVLTSIIRPLPVPMFVVQHMPAIFTRTLAERLNGCVATEVVEATHGMPAEPGTCYIAPGWQQMSLRRQANGTVAIQVDDGPPINWCKPSVEPLFGSAADVYKTGVVAVMLTGMGHDGLDGTRRISDQGCHVIVQDEATSVVWGMPGAVAAAELATEVLPVEEIGPRLTWIISTCAGQGGNGA